jgi:hypothetical protein
MKRRTLGIVFGVTGIGSAVGALALALTPVTNEWGQECGSLLAPKGLNAFSDLTRFLEQAAFDSACPESWSPLLYGAAGLGGLFLILILLGAYYFFASPDEPLVAPKAQAGGAQLSEELARLQDLYNSGALTLEEYSSAKSKLLGS